MYLLPFTVGVWLFGRGADSFTSVAADRIEKADAVRKSPCCVSSCSTCTSTPLRARRL